MNLKPSVLADLARLRFEGLPLQSSSPLKICLWILILVGIAARLSPLANIDDRLFWQYVTEDGYLMQTVARNMAMGLGMSTADGTIPTNGVQPLAVFLFAALHFIADGSKQLSIVLVTLFSTVVSAVSGYYAYKVSALVLSNLKHGRYLAMISAALWFSAPHTISNSMNGLETGIYFAAILFTFNYYLTIISKSSDSLTLKQRLILGFLLGVTFLARNDAVFLIGGLLLAHLLVGDNKTGGGFRHRLFDCLLAGITSVLIALPWLINNYVMFASIIPISGISESHGTNFGQNLAVMPAKIFGSTFIYAPIPVSLQNSTLIILFSIISVSISLLLFWIFSAKLTLLSRRYFIASLIFLTGLSSYYGLFFGAPYFLGRYFSPLSPFLWLATCTTVFFLINAFFYASASIQRATTFVVLVLTLGSATFFYTDFSRGYAKGTSQMHRHVVKWVNENVPESQWVGAPQTGTLGFFHDRTINLDGKVNPVALHARQDYGNVLQYVINSKIDYIADWYMEQNWLDMDPQFAKEFEIVVEDKKSNLSVLKRI